MKGWLGAGLDLGEERPLALRDAGWACQWPASTSALGPGMCVLCVRGVLQVPVTWRFTSTDEGACSGVSDLAMLSFHLP